MIDLDAIRRDLSRWAGRGPTLWVMVKTALTHAIVWDGATLVGLLLGALLMPLVGLHPVWAWSVGLLGHSLGARFYLDRELVGEEADFWKEAKDDGPTSWRARWLARLDSFLDFAIPFAGSVALLWLGAALLGLWGLAL